MNLVIQNPIPISSYDFLIYLITSRNRNSTNHTAQIYFQSSNTYSHMHTTFGIVGAQGPQGFQGYQGDKTFIIDHPTDSNKYLVHACLEGPENGVYYRGKGKIENEMWTAIQLPKYVVSLATNFTIHLSKKYNADYTNNLSFSDIDENGVFIVYGTNCEFHWIVYGERKPLIVEPNKNEIVIQGNGPYKWYTSNK
jgi:hypothetical protein